MIGSDPLCRTYIVYHHGLFAQGVRNVLEERCAAKVVGMETDVTKALKAIRSLQPEVIIIEECTGKHQPMRLGAFLHSAAAGRVVTLSMDHEFATVYQRNRTPVTDIDELVRVMKGVAKEQIPGPEQQPGKVGTADLLESGLGSECENGTRRIMKSPRRVHRGKEAAGTEQGSARGKDGRDVRMNPKDNKENNDG